jgi:hypothetical protein
VSLVLQACVPALVGLALTLFLLSPLSPRDAGGTAVIIAIGATATMQGGLLIGEFAKRSGLRALSYADRLRAGLYLVVPFGAAAVVALLVFIYIGLSGAGTPPPDFYIGPAIVLLGILGSSILLSPALVLGTDLGGALERALKSIWRPVAAVALATLYAAAMTGAVWLVPDQLVSLGLTSSSDLALVRSVAGWLAVAVLGIPTWWTVARLYIAPATP